MIYSKKIFREYDIRGVYQSDYDADFASLLGRALAQYIKKKTKPKNGRSNYVVAIGKDARLSGDTLCPKLMNSFLEEGFDVLDLGLVPTPVVYYSTFHCDVDGAVCVTGSHNPSEYNGFKMCLGTSTLHGHDIQELFTLCETLKKETPKSNTKAGKRTPTEILDAYKKEIEGRVKLDKKIKVVVDAGNGTAAVVAPQLLKAMGCDVIPLFCEVDGRFPNHHPDPTVVENLVDLQKAVAKHKADLGIAYDGDSDRIGVVDETGRPIFGDELMVLYSREILARKPGSKIISEVKCSTRLYEDIAKHGGKPIMWKTGHSLIKAKMKEEKAELAGEMSGHMFFADRYFGYDDAIYASVRLLEILTKTDKKLSMLLSDLPPAVNTPEIRVDCEDEIKFQVVDLVKKDLAKQFKTIDVDGVRVETPKGWGLLRASNTQPVIVMRFEAANQTDLDAIQKTIETSFEKAKKELKNSIA